MHGIKLHGKGEPGAQERVNDPADGRIRVELQMKQAETA